MSEFRIIEFQQVFFEKINSFWNETGLGGIHRGDNIDVVISTIMSGGHLLIMINDENEVIGTSWLTNDKRRTYLHHFGIKEKYRGKGLAKKLMDKSMTIAYQLGCQVKLEVHKDNIPAVNLYKEYGFKYLGDYDVLINREIELH